MLRINKEGSYIKVVGEENKLFPDNGSITFPLNSLVLTIDESDIATFRSAANNDVIFSAMIGELTISDNAVSKDNIMSAWALVAYSTSGGGGGGAVNSVNGQTGDVVVTASSIGAYSKSEVDNLLAVKAEKAEITALNNEISGIHTTTDAQDTRITENAQKIGGLEVEMGEVKASVALKQDELVSGTNIKTINNESILGQGNIEIVVPTIDAYTRQQTDDLLAGKQDKGNYATDTYVQQYTYDKATIDNKVSAGGTFDPSAYYNKNDVDNLLAEKAGNNQALSVQNTSIHGENSTITLSKNSVDNTVQKQDTINFKTINGNAIIGSGNIQIDASTDLSDYYNKAQTDSAIDTKIAALVNSAPETLDTLEELANALGDDPNFAATMTTELGKKANVGASYTKEESDAKYLTEHQSLENYLTKADASNTYEPKLVSGTTIKTINNQSILGSGNILIEAGSTIDAYTKTESNQLFVLIETYNAKITELESRITSLESSLGNVSTSLDSINGEVIA